MQTGLSPSGNAALLGADESAVILPSSWYGVVKAGLDILLAAALLVLLAPVILLSMLAVKLTSHGPALYSQVRLGRGGRPYKIYKIRSMYHECERHSGPKWAITNDPRVTPVGWFLRVSHLDELPQLWNVLRGEMSLIGPRPERPEFVQQLDRALPGYRDRMAIRPGITGLAQVQLPPDTDLLSVRRKLTCDLFYMERMSPLLDLRILLATSTKVLGIPCAVACKVLRIPSESAISEARQVQSARGPCQAGFWLIQSDLDAVST